MKNHEGFCVLHVLNPLVRRRDMIEQELQIKPDILRVGPEGGRVPPEVESAIQQARGDGQFLEGALQEQMGASLGRDFNEVRIHTGAEADDLNRRLSARAFTIGSDIFFTRGAYDPNSISGRELIAHELIHVVQQRNGGVSGDARGMTVRPAGDEFEQEADNLSQIVAGTRDVLTEPHVQRRLPEVAVVQRALRNRTANIDNFPDFGPINNKTCLGVVIYWLCLDALEGTAPTADQWLTACANNPQSFMDDLAQEGTKRSRRSFGRAIIVDAGSVLFFTNAGRVAHACVMGNSATGALGLQGVNQGGGWWTGGHKEACPMHGLCSHNPSEINWSGLLNSNVRVGKVDHSVYTLSEVRAVNAVKKNLE